MLLVSGLTAVRNRNSPAALRAQRAHASDGNIDPTIATKFWHSDCVFADPAAATVRRLVTGHDCGWARRQYRADVGAVNITTNFYRAGPLTR